MPKALLEITGLKKYYPIEAGIAKKQVGLVKAVDDVTLQIQKMRCWEWLGNRAAEKRLWAGRF